MATINAGRLNYTVGYSVDKASINNVKQALEQLKLAASSKDSPLIDKNNAAQSQKNIQKVIDTANKLETALNKSYNVKLGTYSITQFNKELQKTGLSMTAVQSQLRSIGAAGDAVGLGLAKQFTQVELKATRVNNVFTNMGDTLKRTLTWNISSSIINQLTGKVQEAYGYVKNLDKSLNDIRIVTEKSAEQMDVFAEKANKAAKALGKSTTDYTNASLIYYQQGLSDEETAARTDVTLKAANVTQQSTAEVSEQLTAVWNGYKVSAAEAELYVDKLAAVAAGTASDLEELSTGMSKVASAANLVGMDVDQMNAALATTISVTKQAPESVGTAYKTILARMTTISAGGTDEDGADLTSYTEKMNTFGINVLDSTGKLRQMGDVIEEVGSKWSSMSKEAQISLAQVMAGTRQYNNLTALFDNWDMYESALETSKNSAGTLQEQQEIYLESTAAHLQELRTAAEGAYDSLLSPELINDTVDGLTSIVTAVEKIIDSFNGLEGVLPVVLAMFSQLFAKNVGKAAGDFSNWMNTNERNARKLQEAENAANNIELQSSGQAANNYLKEKRILINSKSLMSEEEFNAKNQEIEKIAEDEIKLQKLLEERQKRQEELQAKVDKGVTAEDLSKKTDYYQPNEFYISEDIYKRGKEEERDEEIKRAREYVKELKDIHKDEAENLENHINKLETLKAKQMKLEKLKQISSKTKGQPFTSDEKDFLTNDMEITFYNDKGRKKSNNDIKRDIKTKIESMEKDVNVNKAYSEYQEAMDKIAKTVDEVSESHERLLEVEENFKEKTEEANIKLNEQADILEDQSAESFVAGLTSIGAGIASLTTSAIASINTLKNIWEDDDLTPLEKMGQTIVTIGASVGATVSSFKSLSEGLKLVKAGFDASDLATEKRIQSQKLLENQTKETTAAEIKQATATKEAANASREATQAVNAETIADNIQSESSEEAAEDNQKQAASSENVADSSREAAQAVIGESIADNTQSSPIQFNSTRTQKKGPLGNVKKENISTIGDGKEVLGAFGNMLGGIGNLTGVAAGIAAIGAIAAAIIAWGVAIKRIGEAYNETKIKVEEANKNYEEQREILSRVKDAQNNFNESINRITEQKNVMSELTKGTKEYEEALNSVNNSIEQLLETYPELKKLAVFSGGAWTISDEDLKNYQQQLEENVKNQKIATYQAENAVKQAEQDNLRYNFTKNYGVQFKSEGQAEKIDNILNNSLEDLQKVLAIYQQGNTKEAKKLANELNLSVDKTSDIEKYLIDIIALKENELELEQQTLQNRKAILDLSYGDEIDEEIEERTGINREENEEFYDNLKNAIYTIAGSDGGRLDSIKKQLRDSKTYYEEKDVMDQGVRVGTVFNHSKLAEDKRREYEEEIKKYYSDLGYSDIKVNFKGAKYSVEGVAQGEEESEVLKSGTQKDLIEERIEKDAFNSEQMKLAIQDNLDAFLATESAEASAILMGVLEGSKTVNDFSVDQLKQLSNRSQHTDRILNNLLKQAGYSLDDLDRVIKKAEETEEVRSNNFGSKSEREAYEATSELAGFENLTGEERDKIAEKIKEIYSKFGEEGIKNYLDAISSENNIGLKVDVALEYDAEEAKSRLSKEVQELLESAKIDESTFEAYKKKYEEKGYHLKDEEIARALASQKQLEAIQKKRTEIFKSIADENDENHLDNLISVTDYVQALFGDEEIDQQWVKKNYQVIEDYITNTEGAVERLQELYNKDYTKESSFSAIFGNYEQDVGALAPEGLKDKVNELAQLLQIEEEDIKSIYEYFGYYWDESKKTYVKKYTIDYTIETEKDLASKAKGTDSEGKTSFYSWDVKEALGKSQEQLEAEGWEFYVSGGIQYAKAVVHFQTEEQFEAQQNQKITATMSDEEFEKLTSTLSPQQRANFIKVKSENGVTTFITTMEYITKEDHRIDVSVPDVGNVVAEDALSKSYTKIERNAEFDLNYDSWEKIISYKEKELSRLEEAAEQLTGDALLRNLEERKKIYEEINKQREDELAQNEIDLARYEKEVAALGAKIDPETGYILNERDILKSGTDALNAKSAEYNKYIKEDGTLDTALMEANGKSQEEIDKINDNYKNLQKSVSDTKEVIENYNKALDKNIELLEDSIEDLKLQAELQATEDIVKVTAAYEDFTVASEAAAEEATRFQDLLSDDKAVDERIADLTKLGEIQKSELAAYEEQLTSARQAQEELVAGLAEKGIKIELTGNVAKDTKAISDEISSLEESIVNTEDKIKNAVGAEKEKLESTLAQLFEKKSYLEQISEEWERIGGDIDDVNKKIQDMNDALSTSVQEMEELSEWKTGHADKQFEATERQLSRLQSQEGRLSGQALINNLNQQKSVVQQQIRLEREKLKVLQAQLKARQAQLKESLKQLAVDAKISVKFEDDGSVNTTSLWNSLNENRENVSDQVREEITSLVDDINGTVSEINSIEDAIFGHEQDILDLQDKMKDAAEQATEKLKEEMSKALEIFNAKVDVEVNIEDAWRQFDRLEKKVDGLRERSTEIFQNALTDYTDAIHYITANPNSYFGDAGGGSVQILTQHVNDIMREINIMQAGGTSSLYGVDQSTAFGDLENYYGQLMSAVEGFYDSIDAAKQKYSEAIDTMISKNSELLNDFEQIKSLQDHGINLTKLLFGEESFEEQNNYLERQSNVISQQLQAAVEQRDYYKQLLNSVDPVEDEENYNKVKSAYLEAIDAVYGYAEEKLEKLNQQIENSIDANRVAMQESLATDAGFGSAAQMNRDWEYKLKVDEDYLDTTNTQYEIESLTNKFNEAISGADSLSAKEKITDVMNEQLDILNEQLEKGQKLTKYDIERANKVYELTLKQIALEEAQENKSKMRLRRDSQGNYRYEYVADQENINNAKQELLDAQNDLYNFDKERAKTMVQELTELTNSYYEAQKAIIDDLTLTEEQKDAELLALQERYWGEGGLITMAKEEYLQASGNAKDLATEELTLFDQTIGETLAGSWQAMVDNIKTQTDELIIKCQEQTKVIEETMQVTTDGAVDLESAIIADTIAMEELVAQDEELLEQYDQQIEAIQELMVELQALEAQYKAVMDAAMAAVEQALLLRQTNWETETEESANSGNNGNNISGNSGGAQYGSQGNHTYDRYAKVFISETEEIAAVDPANPDHPALEKAIKKKYPNVQGFIWENWDNAFARNKGFNRDRIKFDTGGYTGAWGSEGRMAMLHEKELVLNKVDTANILQAVDIVRTVSSDLAALQAAVSKNMISQLIGNNPSASGTLEQNVKIEAHFPNVSSSSEIEQAFNNLVNLASQRAMRK